MKDIYLGSNAPLIIYLDYHLSLVKYIQNYPMLSLLTNVAELISLPFIVSIFSCRFFQQGYLLLNQYLWSEIQPVFFHEAFNGIVQCLLDLGRYEIDQTSLEKCEFAQKNCQSL